MLKIRACLISAFIVFASASAVYATSHFPVNLHSYERIDIRAWDALEEVVSLDNQLEAEIYTVAEGDNLYRIAVNHDIPLETLMSWNDLTNYVIYPGDELKMYGEEVKDLNEQKKVVATVPTTIPTAVPTPPAVSQPVVQQPKEEVVAEPPVEQTSKEMTVTATAYTAYCKGCSGTTAYGIDLRANPNQKVIAVDPRVIPLGTKVWVEGYGEAIAGDTGGAIKGKKIDVFIPTYENAVAWGVKTVKIRILN
ncbi:3D domain-containing protein [Lysinibacillus sp. KU-BSD001]|uniref:3D domain-containing protein n=1 Tax=Lysinibacillus sp. KU-BSD001 TaxID=3141328 RepID=UPI0036E37F39